MSAAGVGVGVTFIVINMFLALFLAWGTYRVYQRRNQVQWSARHIKPLFATLIWSIFFITVERTLQLLGGIVGAFEWPYSLGWCFNNVFLVTFISLYLFRTWLVHYDYHSGIALYNLVTNANISEDIREHMKWFLENKVNYGSPKYLFRFTVAMSVIINLFLLGWSALSQTTFYYGMAFVYCALIAVSMGITNKLRILNDVFLIRQELVNEWRVMAWSLLLAGVFVCFANPMGLVWGNFLLVELSVAVVFGMGVISTWGVLKHTAEAGFESNLELANGALPIVALLSNDEATGMFVEHLTREMMAENIFFLSDVMAFKASFVDRQKLRQIDGFSCPVVSSLSRLMFRRTFTHYAWAISKTYVDGSSAFYVTAISDEVRDRCVEFVENQNPGDEKRKEISGEGQEHYRRLHQAFDEAAVEVYRVLNESYRRFTHSDNYRFVNVRGQSQAVNQELANVLASRTQK